MSPLRCLIVASVLALPAASHAQSAVQTSGATIVVPAYGEVTRANDEAHATFAIEEQDKDKSAAASRVNLKMKQGMEILRRGDPQAKLQTRGYYTYPVYADETPARPLPKPQRQLIGWRVGQYVDLTTSNLAGLPGTVAAAQRVLTLNGLHFGLSRQAQRELDRERIEAAYRNLNDRVGFILAAMGRNPSDASIDTVDFEGTGNYAPNAPQAMRAAAMPAAAPASVEEPSFEPGETTLTMRVVGRVKLR
ncbi:MAG TPA: SIMPL domain-containing protein [Usitatibacter sp.]|nr:SIMPL domain-containing protein [Usitatibacter sp.]